MAVNSDDIFLWGDIPDAVHVVTDASPEDVFGPYARTAFPDTAYVPPAEDALAAGGMFQMVVLALFVGYCAVVYYYRNNVAALLKAARSKLFMDKLIVGQNHVFSHFLDITMGLSLVAMGVAAIRYADIFTGPEILSSIPRWAEILLCPATIILFYAIFLYRKFALSVAGRMTLSKGFTDSLLYLRRILTSTGGIVMIPVLLLLALNDSMAGTLLAWTLAAMFAAWTVDITVKTCRFFIDENVSILHWFLYLCAVEIFPISIFVFLALRGTF